jgi:hypothetical protein
MDYQCPWCGEECTSERDLEGHAEECDKFQEEANSGS